MRQGKSHRSLRSVMVTPLFLFLTGSWIVMCLFSYVQIDRIIEKKSREGVMYGLSQRMQILNERLYEMESGLHSIVGISLREAWSYMNNISYYRRAESKRKINEVLELQETWCDSICLLIDRENEKFLLGTFYLTQSGLQVMLGNMEEIASNNSFVMYHPIPWDPGYRLVVTFDFYVGPVSKRQKLTAVVITNESVEELLNEIAAIEGDNDLLSGHVFLTDPEGNPVRHSNVSEGRQVRILSQPNSYGMRLCYEIPESVYYEERNRALIQMTVIMVVGLVVAVVIGTSIVRRIRQPIQQITDTIEGLQLGNPLDAQRLGGTGITEYDLILSHTAQADQRIRQAMETVLAVEKEKRAKDVMLLRMQINPHFLYNALNAVQWMARCNDTQGIEEYMKALLYILHYNLDDHGNHLVPLSKEIELMQAYVKIHRFRYENEIICEVVGDDQQLVMVPRFILQPLVENSIYHGLRNGNGKIELIISRQDEKLRLSVRDNGSGIAPDVLRSIHRGKKQGMGIGIRYVKVIVEESGGTLEIRNIVRGGKTCGTEAVITLDIVESSILDEEAPSLPLC